MFPDFNIYSTPLLILVIQGLILSVLLFVKYYQQKEISLVLLGLLLLVTCYHRTTYTIGFMGWYDSYRNTKINYYLISLMLAIGPLIYFYIRSNIELGFRYKMKYFIHFIPLLLLILFRLFILAFDSQQQGYAETQNGPLLLWTIDHLSILIEAIITIHLFLYLYYSFKLYYQFRNQLNQEYSNTYQYELRWFHTFLILFALLFIYNTIQSITDGFFLELHWTQEWWYQFFSILVVIYIGVKAYFTPLEDLRKIKFNKETLKPKVDKYENKDYLQEVKRLCEYIELNQSYLDPNLSLHQLSRELNMNANQLSKIINKGTNKNFNDFINGYRIEQVKTDLQNLEKAHLSILAIAFDSGFNSKATFNRVFKKMTGNSPSHFRNAN